MSSDVHLISYNSPEYTQQVQLRYEVLRAPLDLQFTEEYLAKDQYDLLFGYFDQERVVGCCQITSLGEGVFQLRQMAVSSLMQGKDIGRKLVQYVENFLVQRKKAQKMVLHAREVAHGFYEKLGYHIEGAPFLEVGIPHYTMYKFFKG